LTPQSSIADTLALGTAQLGQRYGIANRTGQANEAVAHAILDVAWQRGVRYLDTAQGYGRSEQIIGRYLRSHTDGIVADLNVVTKLHPDADLSELDAWLEGSWERLGSKPIWGMLLHREVMLECWEGHLGETLRKWRDRGRIGHLGVSVTSEEGMRKAIEMPDLHIIQAPASAFDRRIQRAGLFERANKRGKTVFVRSVFLQGVMLLASDETARRLPLATAIVRCFETFCLERGIDRRRFGIGYARHHAPGAMLVIGSETPGQVAENCRLVLENPIDPCRYAEWDAAWPVDDPNLVDPSTWPLAKVA
jgi:aryl-alcohol dehydrogenase-like predicted oxidoreductase